MRGGRVLGRGSSVPAQSPNNEMNAVYALLNGGKGGGGGGPAPRHKGNSTGVRASNESLSSARSSSANSAHASSSSKGDKGNRGTVGTDNGDLEFDDHLDDDENEISFNNNNNSILYQVNTAASAADSQSIIDGLKSDIMSLQHALNAERMGSKGTNSSVLGSQFRISGKEIPKCENCQIHSHNLKKSKETIRSLKLQMSRLEDKYAGLRKSKSYDDTSVDIPKPSDHDLLQKKCDDYEIEIGRLRKNAKTDQYAIESLQKLLLEWQMKDDDHNREKGELRGNNEKLTVTKSEQNKTIEKLKADMGQYKMQLEHAELKLSRVPQNDDENKEKELEIVKLRHLLAENESDREMLLKEIADLRRELQESAELVSVKEKDRLAAVVAEENMASERNNAVKDKQETEEGCAKRLEAAEKNRLDLNNELHDEKGKVIELANENVELLQEIQRLRDLLRNGEEKSQTTQDALQKAIAQSVRLCVVAPTVNVHVSTKKMKFLGGLQEQHLKEFLDKEILEKYSILFKQEGDSMSPEGTSIQGWLQVLLGEMQTSIEGHVNKAMEEHQSDK